MKMTLIPLLAITLASLVAVADASVARDKIVGLACMIPETNELRELCQEVVESDTEKLRVEAHLKNLFSKEHARDANMKAYVANGALDTQVVCSPIVIEVMRPCVITSSAGDDGGKYYLTTRVTVIAKYPNGPITFGIGETKGFAVD